MDDWALSRGQRHPLERQLQETRDARVFRRTLAILQYDRGESISHIARMLGVDRRSVSRWNDAYRQTSEPDALHDEPRPGRPRQWTDECTDWLEAFVRTPPTELGYFAGNWTVPLLRQCVELCTNKRFSDDTLRRALRSLGYTWKRTRYVLAPDPEREKKTPHSPGNWPSSAPQRRAG